MTQSRREFLWSAGAVGAAWALVRNGGVQWSASEANEPEWMPGTEARTNSTCLLCPSRCGIRGRVVDGNLVQIAGNPLHPMSQGGLCPRGIAGVQMLYHPNRLTTPLVRDGARGAGHWKAITPEGAVALLGQRLQALRASGRPEALAVLAGYCAGSMEDVWRRFMQAYGSPNYIADDYNDGTDVVMDLMHGIPRRPAYDLEHAGLVLSFGTPLFEAWWSPLQAYVAFGGPGHSRGEGRSQRLGPRFVQIDTRFSRTAARAHEWVGITPGTYGTLALGIAYVLIKEQLIDVTFIAEHVDGFEDWRDKGGDLQEGFRSLVLRHYRSEEVSAVTGVSVERIVSLAKSMAEHRPAVAVFGAEVLADSGGLFAGLAVQSLNVLMGNINRVGGLLFSDRAPVEPLVTASLDQPARAGLDVRPVAATTAPFGGGDPALKLAQAVAGEGGTSPVDVLLMYYANPLASSTHPEVWSKALSHVPFVVSFSPFLDESARHADLILPDLLPYERWQDAPAPSSYPFPVWGIAQPLVEPRGGKKSGMATGDALLALAQRIGGTVAKSLPYTSMEELLKSRARGLYASGRGMVLGSAFERGHSRQMEERGWWLPQYPEFDSFWSDLVDNGGWADLFHDVTDPARLALTPSGRIQLMPVRLRDALAAEGKGRTLYQSTKSATATAGTQFPLRLIPYRVSTLASGTLALEPWLAEQPTVFPDTHWVPWVELSPKTAQQMGLHDGVAVWVISSRGRYRARLKVFPGAAPQNVNAPYGLAYPDGESANPLHLLDEAAEPLTSVSAWYSTFVRLERA